MIRTELDSAPEELDTLRRKIMQLEIEQAALKKETDQLSKERLSQLEKELSDMRDQFQAMSARWENRKGRHRQGAEAARRAGAGECRHRPRRAGI